MNDVVSHETYIAGLRWRQRALREDLASVRARLEELTQEEARILNQLRPLESLLAIEPGAEEAKDFVEATSREDGSAPMRVNPVESRSFLTDPVPASASETQWEWPAGTGPKARLVYQAVDKVLREAAAPMHYRFIADEVQKVVPLRGSDPAATLIAHLSRARSLFPRVARGFYWLAGEPLPIGVSVGPTERRRAAKRMRRARRSR